MILHSAKIGPKLEALSKFCENLEHEEPFGGGPRAGQTKQKRTKTKNWWPNQGGTIILHSAQISPKLETLVGFCENLERVGPFWGWPTGGSHQNKEKMMAKVGPRQDFAQRQ